MTMLSSAPVAPQQQGGALRGFGVLGNRVSQSVTRRETERILTLNDRLLRG